jgi:hypothetical protein
MDERVCFACNRCAMHCRCGAAADMRDPWPVMVSQTIADLGAMGVRW